MQAQLSILERFANRANPFFEPQEDKRMTTNQPIGPGLKRTIPATQASGRAASAVLAARRFAEKRKEELRWDRASDVLGLDVEGRAPRRSPRWS